MNEQFISALTNVLALATEQARFHSQTEDTYIRAEADISLIRNFLVAGIKIMNEEE